MKKIDTGRFHCLILLDVAYAIGLVGLVTLPAAPSGHRPPSPMEKPQIVFRVRLGVAWIGQHHEQANAR